MFSRVATRLTARAPRATSSLLSQSFTRTPLRQARAFAAAAKKSSKKAAASAVQPDAQLIRFPGAETIFTTDLNINVPTTTVPCYRVLDERGTVINKDYDEKTLSNDELVTMYETMSQLNVMDQIFYDVQRQGRISFYMTHYGEEASLIGSAAALRPTDIVYGQYREAGVLMWRGFSLQEFTNQLLSTQHDLGKGRQMPVHYGCRALNFHTISSPLATQIPQAAGAAYALKRNLAMGKTDAADITVSYFGDGAASEGDFHAALNFAATLDCPIVFFCRNNGYAISTPTAEQYRGDGIAARGPGYGIPTVRVDGNDLLAVHQVTQRARAMAADHNKPVLIEAMTYRGGHHSTSDDSSRYREGTEIDFWSDNLNPLTRTRAYLEQRGCWDQDKEDAFRAKARKDVLTCMDNAEKNAKFPAVSQLFTDVYDKPTPAQLEQQASLHAHVAKYADKYPNAQHETDDAYVDMAAAAKQLEQPHRGGR